jgi:hypothetical protein
VLDRLGLKDKHEIQNLTKLFAEGYNSIFTARTPDLEVVKDDPDDNTFCTFMAFEPEIPSTGYIQPAGPGFSG